jgi:hypothetical protein
MHLGQEAKEISILEIGETKLEILLRMTIFKVQLLELW